ncbi:Transcriptional regulator, AcrR family [Cupriavidus sp. U2]|uniref:TetR/AcrR family transcriptional regulator n=1 Tax=Cupriavidus sp. U2 TaxID=2920269 RepID=UPI00129EC0B4|nr:TetR/AcrR family transcriptional regulator [Cupriavidus sp. U2]KAI3593006.1 Transcriptional regulator, AcrR family [Cupriavidus sp. U2]
MKLKQARAMIADEQRPPAHAPRRTPGRKAAAADADRPAGVPDANSAQSAPGTDAAATASGAPDGLTDTARRILEIAERLFAEQGVEQVPLRQIVVESGQRNRSALHYHFGSREALVSHLLNRRLHQVNEIRHRHLDELEGRGRPIDIHGVVEATIRPLVEVVLDTDWGTNYLQVLAQTTFSPALLNKGLVDKTAMSALYRVREHLYALLPDVPRDVMKLRLIWFMDTVVYSLAHWVRERSKRARSGPPVEELIDFCAAALAGPRPPPAGTSGASVAAPGLATSPKPPRAPRAR